MRRLISLLLLFAGALRGTAEPQGNEWMKGIADDRLISSITLPGTHNAGALKEPLPNTARCQSMGITEQLKFGVRLLDIRCRHVKDRFLIYHGMANQDLTFDQVLNEVTAFLEANPSECVVMSIAPTHRAEENTRGFAATLQESIAKNPKRWHLADSPTRLGDLRGKVVLLRRFQHDQPLGLDASKWGGNGVFEKNGLRVQDRFKADSTQEKWTRIVEGFDAAAAERDSTILHLNFTSGYEAGAFGLPNITAVSNVINPKLQTYLGEAKPGFHGWVMMDFATADLARAVFSKNFE